MLVHQDAEIVDAGLLRRSCARRCADPEVGLGRLRRRRRRAQHRLVGGVGDAAPRSSTATRSTAAATCRRSRGRGARRPPTRGSARSRRSTGSCSCCRPWAVRNIRFDEELGTFHGYDLDFCLQVREAGRKVVTADFRAIHHRPLEMVPDPERVDRRPHAGGRQVGRPDGHRRPAPAAGASERCGPRPSADARAYARAHERARVRRAGPRAQARARRDDAGASRGGSPPRCGGCGPALGDAAEPRRVTASHGVGVIASVAIGPRPTGATPSPGIRLAAEPDSEVLRVRGRRLDLPQLQPDARRRAARATSSRRWSLVHPHTEIVDPEFCAKVRARASRSRTWAWRDAPARRGVRSIAWWEGDGGLRRRSSSATRSTAAASSPGSRWARPTPPPAEVDAGRRPTAGALALGGAQPALRRGAVPRPRLRRRLQPAGPRRPAAS